MSKFHTTVSRRNFMKGLGLAGAGIGAAAATAPVFRDIDEVGTSSKAIHKEPWYVKELEFERPSNDVDWSAMAVWDSGPDPKYRFPTVGYTPRNAHDEEGYQYWVDGRARFTDTAKSGLVAGTAGYTLRDHAYRSGAGGFGPDTETLGPDVTTPEDRGVSKWTGTPEEATNMMRAVAHAYGSAKIGVLELTANTRKLAKPSRISFVDANEPATEGSLKLVPNKAKWALAYVVGQPTEMTKRGNTQQQSGSSYGYSYGPIIKHRLQKFLKSIGYMAIDGGSSDFTNVAAGALSGCGELARTSHQMSHEWGCMTRYSPVIFTDLNMAPTKPIDFGGFKFCQMCKTCAETCDEINGWTPLSLETEPSYEITGPWNRTGYKAYQIDWTRCMFCPYCQGVCPWSNHDVSAVHTMVKIVAANTSIFNGFFTQMGKAFGYKLHDETERLESWWDRDLNSWPYDVILR